MLLHQLPHVQTRMEVSPVHVTLDTTDLELNAGTSTNARQDYLTVILKQCVWTEQGSQSVYATSGITETESIAPTSRNVS